MPEQSDKAETASALTVKNANPEKLTPEDEAFLKRKAELVGGSLSPLVLQPSWLISLSISW